MIGSSVVEVEVDGETKYKVVFELEATEETVEAAQQEEEEVTRINNSLVLPVSSAQTTTTRIESSVFIPVSSTGSADGVVQALVEAIKDQGIEVESFTFDPETGELSYVVKIVNYAGSGSSSLENTIEGALEQEGIDNDDVTHGTSKATTEDTVVQNLIDAIEEQDGVEIETYTYDAETGEFEYTIKVTISDLAPASGSGSAKASLLPLDGFEFSKHHYLLVIFHNSFERRKTA